MGSILCYLVPPWTLEQAASLVRARARPGTLTEIVHRGLIDESVLGVGPEDASSFIRTAGWRWTIFGVVR